MMPGQVAERRAESVKERVVGEFLPFIRYTARRLSWRLPPGLSEDDLVSAGVVGLLDAQRKYREGEAKLKTFAEYRIKGAMLDELRAADPLPRTVRDRVNAMKAAHRRLEHALGRMPEDDEVAAALGVTLDEYHKTLRESTAALHLRFEDFGPSGNDEGHTGLLESLPDAEGRDPESLAERSNLLDFLAKVISDLPERERVVLSLYYWEEMTMREIGEVFGLSEGRVCQLHSQALLRCRAGFDRRTPQRSAPPPFSRYSAAIR